MDRQISREAWQLLHGAQADDGEYESSYRKSDRLRELDERGFLPDVPLSAEVMNARRASFTEALLRAMEARRQPYQMLLPGMNPTLMQLRSREPLTAEEGAAAGVIDWSQQEPVRAAYDVSQGELFSQPLLQQVAMSQAQEPANARRGQNSVDRQLAMLSVLLAANPAAERVQPVGNEVVITPDAKPHQLPAVEAAVEQAKNSRVPFGREGRRMAMRYGLPTLGALLGLYGLAAVTDGDEREYAQV